MKEEGCSIFSFSENKQRIDTLINGLHIGVLVQGSGSEILFCNKAALNMLGLSWDELNGRSSFADCNIIHEDGTSFSVLDHPGSRVLATKRAVANIIMGVYRPITKDRVWLLVNAEPLLDDNGNVKEVISSFSDITERKSIEEKLTSLYQSLESRAFELATSNADLQRFVYVATHDLQEPLRMVTSFTQLLKKKYEKQLDEQAIEYINYAVENASRMKKLILDLLEYSQFSSNNEEFVQTAMNNVVKDVTTLFSKQIEGLQAELIVSELPVIKSKTLLMHQLFEKLVSNALKYHNGGKPVIKIDCKENDDHFLFSVNDNGIGIDPKYSDRIFVLFQRLHRDKDAYEGTGVGLAISKKIVELHNGSIWVRSEKGEGSTFYFTIPKEQKRA
ncbi:MAG: PAS domain S-box protein [Chitinophagaceae bacterium]|nr:PAS domain S-box protein [Chitinophagaceae bacterium]